MLRFLKRLKLSNMRRVREVLVPPLEELVLDRMPDLQICSCTSVGDMKSSLRVLEIWSCSALEVFDLFQKGYNYETELKSPMPSLRKLIVVGCPRLQVQTPLPPSATLSKLIITSVSTIMSMEGLSMETLKLYGYGLPSEMMALDDKILAFSNLKDIKYLQILSCKSMTSISFKGLSQLISLKSLKIEYCRELFSSDVVPEQTHEDMITANEVALPSLESLCIRECGITGKLLSLMLQHSPAMKELTLYECPQLKRLKIEEEGKVQSNFISGSETSSSGYVDDAWPNSDVDGVVHIPLNLIRITIGKCTHLIFDGSREDLVGFTSLDKDAREKGRCLLPQSLDQLVWIDYPQKTLRPCFVRNLTRLRKLEVIEGSLEYLQMDSCTALEELEIENCHLLITIEGMQSLGTLRSLVLFVNSSMESLQLHSCTALEHLEIQYCSSLVSLKGLRSLVNLKHLKILGSPALGSLTSLVSNEPTKGISSHSCELFPALESLEVDDLSPLNTSFCKGLTCLRSLTLTLSDATRLTDEQERALLLLRSLQELHFNDCELMDLPARLRVHPSLKTLKIIDCSLIAGLPNEGLPPSLEKLEIYDCSVELSKQCRSLATSKLEVEIDGSYVA
ncbi:hypothetical protein ACQJBY_056696 [Aegilops geniculata]